MNIDWPNGTWRKGPRQPVDARIAVTGDWAPIWKYEKTVLRDPLAVYGDLLPDLRAADLRILNLEAPLSARGTPIMKGGPNLRGNPKAIDALTAVPFNVCTLANNHIFDFGPDAFRDTARLLRRARIRFLGAGLTEDEAARPLVLRVRGARVGLVNFCEGEDLTAARHDRHGTFGWDIERVAMTVRRLRPRVDVLLVIAHAGREYAPLPPPYIIVAFRRIAESGADAIIAHHPHVPQGIEIHRGVPIFYCIGNFVFLYPTRSLYQTLGCLVELHLSRKRLAAFRLIPYRMAPRRVEILDGRAKRWLFGQLRRVSVPLDDPRAVRAAWDGFIDRLGAAGTIQDIEKELKLLRRKPGEAAKVRNLFVTPAHRELWIDAMTRIAERRMNTAPPWARALVDEWADLSITDGLRSMR